MTKVNYERKGYFFSLTCQGHAGYAPAGKDIVCAGISALCGALEITLDNLQDKGMALTHFCTLSDGFFKAEATAAEMNIGVETAFDIVYGGLCRIEEAYSPYLQCSRTVE